MGAPMEYGDKLAALGRWLDTMPEDERTRRQAEAEAVESELDATIAAARETVKPDPGAAMVADLDGRLSELRTRGAGPAEVRQAACAVIASHLGRLYAVRVGTTETRAVFTAVARYGPEAVQRAAAGLLREGRDPKVRNVFALLTSRARTDAEGIAA